MKTKIYLKDPDKHNDIYAIEKNERIYWFRTGQDEKGIFFVLDGKLDEKRVKAYPEIREIEYLE